MGVPAQKIWEGDEVFAKFCDICLNHDFTDRTLKLSEILE